jgi:peptidoglycan/xylan/chitin deacetylase (PgdA/CDA1 family)
MQIVSKTNPGLKIAVFAAPEWPGRYLSYRLANSGLNLKAVVFGPAPLEHVPFKVDNFRHAIPKVGVRPALEALFGFPQGFRHACNRLLSRELSPEIDDLIHLSVPVYRVDDYACSRAHELLRSVAPDVIVICGTSILPESILSIARLCALNIHTSVLPHYRGGGSTFWGLFFRDFEKIGYTIHKAVAQVDAGPYLYQEAVPVKKADTAQSLTERAFRIAAPQLVRILANTDVSDPAVWHRYEKSVPYVWRSPDPSVKRYLYGPTTRQRISTTAKRISHAIRWNPRKPSNHAGVAAFYWHRNLSDSVKRQDWRRVLGHPTIDEVRERIRVIRKYFQVVSLSEALAFLGSTSQAKGNKLAVLTVDDGYLDFRTNLVPLLEELQVPCSFFICSQAVEQGTIWYQRVYDLIEEIGGERLVVPWANCELWFGDVKQRVLTVERVLLAHLKRLSPTIRARCLQELLSANRLNRGRDDRDAFCSIRDILAISESRWVEVHLHGHAHHPFETLDSTELANDVKLCRDFFASRLGLQDNIIGYPNGRIKRGQEEILKSQGVSYGFTTEPGINFPASAHPFGLKRNGLTNSPLSEFYWTVRTLAGS